MTQQPHTHTRDLARALSSSLGIPYQRALERTRRAQAAGLLPAKLDADGILRALETLSQLEHLDRTRTVATGTGEVILARGTQGRDITLSEQELSMHSLVLGSPGTGRSEALTAFVRGMMDLGWDGLVLDMRWDIGSGDLREACAEVAATHHVAYQQLYLGDQAPTRLTPWKVSTSRRRRTFYCRSPGWTISTGGTSAGD
jgi:hypothetical protein